jgi:hypothetical protein
LFWGFLTFFEKANANALYGNLNARRCFFVRIDRFDERRDQTRYSNGSTAVLVILSKNAFVVVIVFEGINSAGRSDSRC